MEKIKQYWKEILLCILLVFGLNKCTQSCNRGNKLKKIDTEWTIKTVEKDSIINVLNDSITKLNIRIQVYEEKVAGLNQALTIQDEASKRISEAKKNISVNVKQQK